MESYKQEFIEFMVESNVLKFGDFTLKSGRKSPFFMNAGAYVTGTQLKKLGEYYAKAIHDNFGLDFDVLFGPAYKGIPTVKESNSLYRTVARRPSGVVPMTLIIPVCRSIANNPEKHTAHRIDAQSVSGKSCVSY